MKPGRVAFGRIALSGALLAPMLGTGAQAAFAATAAGTVISNTASAAYTDGNGNSYTTLSNTVTTTVQNAPSLTIVATPGTNYAPGQIATDTYTVTNTGNSAGTANISAFPQTTTDTPASAGLTSYVVTYNGATTTYTSLANLNTALAADSLATTGATSSLTIAVKYLVPTTAGTATGTNTYTTDPTGTITNPAVGATPAETSAAVTATPGVTDTVLADADLDLQKTGTYVAPAGTVPALFDYTINANNGGNFATKDLASAQTLVGAAVPGILITDETPIFNGNPLTVNTGPTFTTSAANGYEATTAQLYYSTSATGAVGSWTAIGQGATIATGTKVYFFALFLANATTTASLASHPGSTTDTVTAAQAQVTLNLSFVAPAGTGSGAAALNNIANSAIGSNQATETILAPGVPAGTADSASGTPLDTTGQGILNTTSTPTTNPAETSNTVPLQVPAAASVLIGPNGNAGAVGSYTGTGTPTTNGDFTTGVLTVGTTGNASTNSGTVPGTPTGNSPVATTTATVTNTVQNTGNANDTYTLTFGTLPAGVTVTSVTAGGTVITPTGGNYVLPVLASGATQQVVIAYKGTNVQTLTQLDVPITVTGTGGAADTNMTHNDLYDGFVALTKSATVTTTNCPTGVTVVSICPGGTIKYVVDYRSVVPAVVAGSSGNNTAATTATALNVTEDGTVAPNNWAANSGGLVAAVVDANNSATTTYKYYTTSVATGTVQATAPGAEAFVATIGTLNPGGQSTLTFSVTLK